MLESGKSLVDYEMSEEQQRNTKSFALFTRKPRLVVFNLGDNQAPPDRAALGISPEETVLAAPLGLELELSRMDEADRAEFERDLDLRTPRRDEFLRAMMRASGQFTFFTAGEKEVRTWLLPIGGTAVDAADGIHTDLARGFIRAEVMTCDDLVRVGSEREIKAQGLMRREPKDYVVKDGDILLIHHN
jgi:ribosome-binding ATPase YchF (GTP1/OBG family)